MESHRTSLVFRNLQELGRRAVAQLSKDSQLPSYHLDQDWFGSVCLSRPRSLSNRPQCGSPTLPLHSSSPPQDTTGLELHDHSQSVKLFLRGPLVAITIKLRSRRALAGTSTPTSFPLFQTTFILLR